MKKKERSNVRLNVSRCRHVNAYERHGTSTASPSVASSRRMSFPPPSRFPRTLTTRKSDDPRSRLINLPCGISPCARQSLGTSRRGGTSTTDRVRHFRCFRVREATDRTPRFSVLLAAVPRPPRPSWRMRDVEAGESERLYRPATRAGREKSTR